VKKVVIQGEREARLVDVPDPRPKENWAVIKVHAAPMCTEYKAFLAGTPTEFLGHEAAGEVVDVAQPGRAKVGDRVVAMPLDGCGRCELCVGGNYIHCEQRVDFDEFTGRAEGRATYAQYHLKPDWLLLPIPGGVSYERASLACCGVGPSFGAFESMGVGAGDTVLITGLGPVGLGAVVNARLRGARAIGVESIGYRAERARQMGAVVLDPRDDDILDRIKELTDGNGVDYSLESAGALSAERLCIDATRRMGKAAFVGESYDGVTIRMSPDLLRKGLTIIGTWHYNLRHFPRVMKVIQESPYIDQLISHVLPMSEIQAAFTLSASHQTAKVMLNPWE
jgi:threonine dehydrogenase-like Zn-dependent dehydrogenase